MKKPNIPHLEKLYDVIANAPIHVLISPGQQCQIYEVQEISKGKFGVFNLAKIQRKYAFPNICRSFFETNNLFTTSDPPKYLNSNSPNLCFCLLKGDKKTFSLVQKIFSTNKNVFLSPFNKQKQRFGELEFEYFGGSDVVNKLLMRKTTKTI